jgi:hypothetical protein
MYDTVSRKTGIRGWMPARERRQRVTPHQHVCHVGSTMIVYGLRLTFTI